MEDGDKKMRQRIEGYIPFVQLIQNLDKPDGVGLSLGPVGNLLQNEDGRATKTARQIMQLDGGRRVCLEKRRQFAHLPVGWSWGVLH